jgi:hypothetical protein
MGDSIIIKKKMNGRATEKPLKECLYIDKN